MADHTITLQDGDTIVRKHPYAKCELCPMANPMRFKYVGTSGTDGAPFMVVGEAPGIEEISAYPRAPFVGPSGQLMRNALKDVGIDSDNILYTNAVACRPPDNKLDPFKAAIVCCAPRLEHELKRVAADGKILAAGKIAAQQVLQFTRGIDAPKAVAITRERGRVVPPSTRGTVQRTTVLSVHPAYVLRNSSVFPEFQADVRLLVETPPPNPLQTAPKFRIVRTIDELREDLDAIKPGTKISFDVETDNLIWYDRPDQPKDRMLMIGIAASTKYVTIIPCALWESVAHGDEVRRIVSDCLLRSWTVAHNGKFDMLHLTANGFNVRLDYDTMLAHGCIKETPPHGLKELGMSRYHIENYEQSLIEEYLGTDAKKRRYSKVPEDKLALYLAWDCALTYQLEIDFTVAMGDEGTRLWPFDNMLMPASNTYLKIEQLGVKIDVPHFKRVENTMLTDLALLQAKLYRITGKADFNPNSYKQVGWMLFDKIGFKPLQSKHFPDRSTSAPALKQMGPIVENHPFVLELKTYRRIRKLLSSYVLPIADLADTNGFVHPSYNLLGTETGRRSAKGPPIQTLPRSGTGTDEYGPLIRQGFIAPPGYKLVVCDYSQAEMRVWSHFCQDPFLLEVFRSGRDLHTEGAIKLFGPNWTKEQRTWVKNFNFAYVYGGNEYSFSSQFNLPVEAAKAFVAEYEKMMPVARKWRDDVFQKAMRDGYVITPFGRKRRFPLITKETEEEIRKTAWNAPIQSTAADLVVLAANVLIPMGVNIVLEVHDSLGAYAKEEDAVATAVLMRNTMKKFGEKYIPSIPWKVDIEIQDRWALRDSDEDLPDYYAAAIRDYDALYEAEESETYAWAA